MKLGIGIDTGGTYTDAVIYDFENKEILGSAKSLTTKNDLTIGILGAIDGLPTKLVQQADIISLSTTLATNACVENKGGRAKLIFFGGDKTVIDQYGRQYGLPSSDEIYIQESYTHFSGKVDREPDWDLFRRQTEHGFENLDGVGIIEMNAMRNGAVVEKKAREIFCENHNTPVVCGHELFSELNCLQRGSGTLLNAGLFPVIREFLASVKKALAIRNIHPSSLVIVRSDGGLMSEEFSSLRPVETLLCGPAASAIGCTRLTNTPNCIVVDMGGTTTDIAFIEDGKPVTVTDGVSIGRWKTFVNGLYVKTFGLGGDSAIHYDGENLRLEEYRIIPLCIASAQYPDMLDSLRKIEVRKHTKFLYEHYMLIKDIEQSSRYTDEEKAFCKALKEKPLSISDAANAVGKDIYTLRVDRLLKDGVVQLCGLTPTDIMHITGDFSGHNSEASRLGAEFAAFNLDISVEQLCKRVYDAVKKKLYTNIVKAMLENKYQHYMKNGVSQDIERLIEDAYTEAAANKPNALFSTPFCTQYSLIGVGAPIQIFLKDVAEMLGTKAIIPENHEVANALGAIMGSISASYSLEVRPINTSEGISGYRVFGGEESASFEELDEAVQFAASKAMYHAKAEAEKRGAKGDVTVNWHTQEQKAKAKSSCIELGVVVTAHASGTMGF